MTGKTLMTVLEKALWVFAGLMILGILSIPTGLLTFLRHAGWPPPPLPGPQLPPGMPVLVPYAFIPLLFLRHVIWAVIYWSAARALGLVRQVKEPTTLSARIRPSLRRLQIFLVASCILDVLLLPTQLAHRTLPFVGFAWVFGMLNHATRLLVPTAYGVTALILALLVHHYGRLLEERSRMQQELDLTI